MIRFFKKYHKWVGLFFSVFIVMFAFSGIVLNHRHAVSKLDVSRSLLPKSYRYNNWNNGSVKGSFVLSPDSLLLYGGSGIWLTDPNMSSFQEFTAGLAKGTDNRSVSQMLRTADNDVYAVTTFGLYKLEQNRWQSLTKTAGIQSRISDLAVKGDTMVVLTRSHAYHAVPPYQHFTKTELAKPDGYSSKVSLFRMLWLLHSGELFGLPGKLVVDTLGLCLIILCITGFIFTLCPGIIKRKRRKEKAVKKTANTMKSSMRWHNKIGVIGLILFLILTISGMFLRPPLMIAIIRNQVNPIPGSVLDNDNPWHDKLRCLRYDEQQGDWILYSSSGFYSLADLSAVPQPIRPAPPVSVMGVNVMKPSDSGWIIGSFSGLCHWDRKNNTIIDCFTGDPIAGRGQGRPVAGRPVSGFSADFPGKEVAFEYSRGAALIGENAGEFFPMPEIVKKKRMSLWHVCLEIHVGRAYRPFIGPFSELFVFLSGLLLSLILISGYIVYRKYYKKKKRKQV